MKSPIVWFLAVILIASVFITIAFNAGGSPEKQRPASAAAPSPQKPELAPVAVKPATPESSPSPAPVSKLVPDDAAQEVLLEAINDVAITYDPVELPKIKPYLLHSDLEVRKAALNGMVVLGDAAGAPLLRDAARQVASPKEALEMMQAADFLELPSATGQMKDGPVKPKSDRRKPPGHR